MKWLVAELVSSQPLLCRPDNPLESNDDSENDGKPPQVNIVAVLPNSGGGVDSFTATIPTHACMSAHPYVGRFYVSFPSAWSGLRRHVKSHRT